MKPTKKQLEEIKNKLKTEAPDFARKIAPIYTLLDWVWATSLDLETGKYKARVPHPARIEETLYMLIDSLNLDNSDRVETGGLGVEYFLSEEDPVVFEGKIYFTVDEGCWVS